MPFELLYTSAPRGLRPGTSGLCTVAATRGLPPSLARQLEAISTYRPPFAAQSPNAHLNPVTRAHYRLEVGGRSQSVLTHIAPAGLDHTRRPNALAYHLALEPAEQSAVGPAWLLSQPGFAPTTAGEPRTLEPKIVRTPATSEVLPPTDEQLAGQAALLAYTARGHEATPAYLLIPPGFNPLPLIAAALALLPVALRWQVTFSTYFFGLPAGVQCAWRCVMADTPSAAVLENGKGKVILNLTDEKMTKSEIRSPKSE